MGRVTDELVSLLKRHFDRHGVVVWYDPDGTYRDVAEKLELPDTEVLRYDGSFFELRYRIEPFLEFVDEAGNFLPEVGVPPRLLVYVPMDRSETHYALIEAEAAGVVVEPGASPWQRNTRLKVIAERVFKRIAPDQAAEIARKVEAGQLGLSDLDQLAERPGDLSVLELIFNCKAGDELILRFLTDERYDLTLIRKDALPQLVRFLETYIGMRLSAKSEPAGLREELARSLLLAEFALRLEAAGTKPEALSSAQRPEGTREREQIFALCDTWRNRLDLRESYVSAASKVEDAVESVIATVEPASLESVHTFALVERPLLIWAQQRLLQGDWEAIEKLANEREHSIWAEFQPLWRLLAIIAQLLAASDRVEKELSDTGSDISTLVRAYAEGTPHGNRGPLPWYWLDRWQRQMEQRYATTELPRGVPFDALEQLVKHARRRYAEVVGACASRLAEALAKRSSRIPNGLSQRVVFRNKVRPALESGKTAYVLVDALRYEMGLELVQSLGDGFSAKISAVLAQLPTITDVGMAALMPGAEGTIALHAQGAGQPVPLVDGCPLTDRSSRMTYLRTRLDAEIVECKLSELAKPGKKLRERLAHAEFIVATSQEIDLAGELAPEGHDPHLFMQEALLYLRRALRQLSQLGVQRVVIAADHGFYYLAEMSEAMKVDPPGGRTVSVHPRAWVGKGGADSPSYVRMKANQLGLESDLEFVFPLGLAFFKTPGKPSSYFHGGISFQELVIPVVELEASEDESRYYGHCRVGLRMGKSVVSTRFFSVEASYAFEGLFGETRKRIRMVARADNEEVGEAVMAAYGFVEGTKEIILEKDKPDTVTMMLTVEPNFTELSVHALDADTGVELGSLKKVPVSILKL